MNTVPKTETKKELTLGCWNIRRGLIKREHEITELLKRQNLDVLFLVETDTASIKDEKDYRISGYKTLFPLKEDQNQKTRLIALISEKTDNIKIRDDLMNPKFPSIWCEETRENESNLLFCGFYFTISFFFNLLSLNTLLHPPTKYQP